MAEIQVALPMQGKTFTISQTFLASKVVRAIHLIVIKQIQIQALDINQIGMRQIIAQALEVQTLVVPISTILQQIQIPDQVGSIQLHDQIQLGISGQQIPERIGLFVPEMLPRQNQAEIREVIVVQIHAVKQ